MTPKLTEAQVRALRVFGDGMAHPLAPQMTPVSPDRITRNQQEPSMTEPTGDELKPCQFCGSDDVRIVDGCLPQDWVAVECNKCLARGPHNFSDPHAIAAWNTRAEQVVSVEEAARVLLAAMPEVHQAWTDYQSAADHHKEPYYCVEAWLRALAGDPT